MLMVDWWDDVQSPMVWDEKVAVEIRVRWAQVRGACNEPSRAIAGHLLILERNDCCFK